MEPVLDAYGLPEYYPDSGDTYRESETLYDRSGETVREKTSDLTEA